MVAIDWSGIAVNAVVTVVAVSATAAIANVRRGIKNDAEGSVRLDDHEKRLDDHDELHRKTADRLEGLSRDFVPRREADVQFANLQESMRRVEECTRFLVYREIPKPPQIPQEGR